MYVAKEESGGGAHISVSVGNRFPVTDVSYGKWVLAYASEAERERLLADGLRQVTPFTNTDVKAYREQLREIVEAGVLVSSEEYVRGICAISAPILTSDGLLGVLATLGISATESGDQITKTSAVIRELASKYSETPAPIDLRRNTIPQ